MRSFILLLLALVSLIALISICAEPGPGPATWTVRVDGVEQTVTGVSVSEALEQYGAWAALVWLRLKE